MFRVWMLMSLCFPRAKDAALSHSCCITAASGNPEVWDASTPMALGHTAATQSRLSLRHPLVVLLLEKAGAWAVPWYEHRAAQQMAPRGIVPPSPAAQSQALPAKASCGEASPSTLLAVMEHQGSVGCDLMSVSSARLESRLSASSSYSCPTAKEQPRGPTKTIRLLLRTALLNDSVVLGE